MTSFQGTNCPIFFVLSPSLSLSLPLTLFPLTSFSLFSFSSFTLFPFSSLSFFPLSSFSLFSLPILSLLFSPLPLVHGSIRLHRPRTRRWPVWCRCPYPVCIKTMPTIS